MSMLFAVELSPLLLFIITLLLLSSTAGFVAFFHIGRCSS